MQTIDCFVGASHTYYAEWERSVGPRPQSRTGIEVRLYRAPTHVEAGPHSTRRFRACLFALTRRHG